MVHVLCGLLHVGTRDAKLRNARDAKAKTMIQKSLARMQKLLGDVYPQEWRTFGHGLQLTSEEVVNNCWLCSFPWREEGDDDNTVKLRLQLHLAFMRYDRMKLHA